MRKPTAKQLAARLDDEIERIVRTDLSGVPISLLDIGKVFKAGREAHAAGQDVRDAVVSTYRQLSQGTVSHGAL